MRFEFFKVPPRNKHEKWREKPVVTIDIFNGGNTSKAAALIDSGADDCIFHSELAKSLGIDLSHAPTIDVGGVSGIGVGYVAPVEYSLEVIPEIKIKIDAVFMENLPVGALLGINGFFNHFRVKFERDRGIFEVNPIKK